MICINECLMETMKILISESRLFARSLRSRSAKPCKRSVKIHWSKICKKSEEGTVLKVRLGEMAWCPMELKGIRSR